MKILVINTGSSSIKYQLFDMVDETVLASGMAERIGSDESMLSHTTMAADGSRKTIGLTGKHLDHARGLARIAAHRCIRINPFAKFTRQNQNSVKISKNLNGTR